MFTKPTLFRSPCLLLWLRSCLLGGWQRCQQYTCASRSGTHGPSCHALGHVSNSLCSGFSRVLHRSLRPSRSMLITCSFPTDRVFSSVLPAGQWCHCLPSSPPTVPPASIPRSQTDGYLVSTLSVVHRWWSEVHDIKISSYCLSI